MIQIHISSYEDYKDYVGFFQRIREKQEEQEMGKSEKWSNEDEQ